MTFMVSMTYGVMPSREQFSEAFERECPDGYRISLNRLDSTAVEPFKLGDGCLSEQELWEGITEIVTAYDEGWPDQDADSSWFQNGMDQVAIDLVSSILFTLGFEWI